MTKAGWIAMLAAPHRRVPRLWPLASVALAGCYLSHPPPDGAEPSGVEGPAGAPASPRQLQHPPSPDAGQFFQTPCDEPDREPRPVPLDVLFVIDDSASMAEEQAALARQLPALIDHLTAATAGSAPLVRDLHLGVVSTDMGLGGVQGVPRCEGFGDDGVLRSTFVDPVLCPGSEARSAGGPAGSPRFLSYTPGRDDPAATSRDFGCVATLGTAGCGFEQQLEAGLKALWPAQDVALPQGRRIEADGVSFSAVPGGPSPLGHGTRENAGFLRHEEASVVAVIVVTDEDDCSSADFAHFIPDIFLDPDDPRVDQPLNLRCFHNPQNLHSIERYLAGFAALRPGLARHVFFAAIAGVPTDLVDGRALSELDPLDPDATDAFYRRILDDARMRKAPDPAQAPETGGRLIASCESEQGRAYPPRRLVELARRFGPNGVVQSICQPDFGPAIDAIATRLVDAATEAACHP